MELIELGVMPSLTMALALSLSNFEQGTFHKEIPGANCNGFSFFVLIFDFEPSLTSSWQMKEIDCAKAPKTRLLRIGSNLE